MGALHLFLKIIHLNISPYQKQKHILKEIEHIEIILAKRENRWPHTSPYIKDRKMHFDPEFETFSYGDKGTKAKWLLKLDPGDLLVFYAGLHHIIMIFFLKHFL